MDILSDKDLTIFCLFFSPFSIYQFCDVFRIFPLLVFLLHSVLKKIMHNYIHDKYRYIYTAIPNVLAKHYYYSFYYIYFFLDFKIQLYY